MKSENNPSGNVSATTSQSAPPKPKAAAPPGQRAAADKGQQPSEADFITRQQEQARAAISAVVADMKRAVADGGNLREWTRQYPWILTGTAAVAGFAAGMLVVPSKDESFRDKWEALKDKLTPETPAEGSQAAAAKAGAKAEQPTSVLGTVLREAMKAVGPMLGGLITSVMAHQNPQSGDGDGHPGNGSYGHAEEPAGAPQD